MLSVAIFEHVEAAEFDAAHRLAAGMVVFALLVLVTPPAIDWLRRARDYEDRFLRTEVRACVRACVRWTACAAVLL